MNPYAFRSWHLPSAYESSTCDRNYPTMYPASWTSSYFSPSSVYPFQTDSAAAASAVAAKNSSSASDWKLQGICSPTPDANVGGVNVRSGSVGLGGVGENGLSGSGKASSGYEGLLGYKPSAGTRADYEGAAAAAREEANQRSCCAISCSCGSSTPCGLGHGGQGSRLNGALDAGSCGGATWRSAADMSPVGHLDFKPSVGHLDFKTGVAPQISHYPSHNSCEQRVFVCFFCFVCFVVILS
jgi:hypothetical protein